MPTTQSSRTTYLSDVRRIAIRFVGVGIPLLVYSFMVRLYWSFSIDDVFISLRFVKQWTHGNGLVYNLNEYVEGYSNFLWIVMLAPFDLLGFELFQSAKWLGALLGALTLVIIWWSARSYPGRMLTSLLLAVNAPFIAWSVSGLETALYSLLVTISVLLFVSEEEKGAGWLSAVFFALTALARPEGIMFAVLATLYRTVKLYRAKTRPGRSDVIRLLILVAIVLPYLGWRLWYYGYPLPNTVYAKSMGLHPRALLEGLYYLYQNFVVVGGVVVVAIPLLIGWARFRTQVRYHFLTLCICMVAMFTVLSGGDWMPLQRFMVPVLPILFLLIQAGIADWSSTTYQRRPQLLSNLVLSGQVAFLCMGTLVFRFTSDPRLFPNVNKPSAMMEYLQAELDPAVDVVAVVDAGGIAYYLPLETRVLDMVGLVDEHIAHLPAQFPQGLLGRGDGFGKWDIDYVLAQDPRFVKVHLVGQDENGVWRTDYTATNLLVNDPRFQARYRAIGAIPGLFERIDSSPSK